MSKDLNINNSDANEHADSINKVSNYLEKKPLDFIDSVSTISAVKNSINNFDSSQEVFELLGKSLDNDAKNISAINVEFHEYDSLISNLIMISKYWLVY